MTRKWESVTRTTFTRELGTRLAVVTAIRSVAGDYWGFVIYDGGVAIGGACDPTWTMDAALKAADEELGD
jgi:hypothetical protein